jgi:acetolactate synthase-1/2/3 large subunit
MKTLIVAGRGALSSWQDVRAFVGLTGWDLVATLPAVGILPTNDPRYLGMLGHTGHEAANKAIAEADRIIVLGARLDPRQTGTETGIWDGKRIVRVELDDAEIRYARVKSAARQMPVSVWLDEELG